MKKFYDSTNNLFGPNHDQLNKTKKLFKNEIKNNKEFNIITNSTVNKERKRMAIDSIK